jgi:oligopeptide/dipeptide ABC transporter ATP-binding protein
MGGVLGVASHAGSGAVVTARPDVDPVPSTGSPALLQVRGLEKEFAQGTGLLRAGRPVQAVAGVSFDIARGETLGLVGESGSGKSTIGKLIVRLLEPTRGSILLQGRDITFLDPNAMRPMRRVVQTIFQDPYSSLNPRMNAGRLVGEPLIIHKVADRKAVRERVADLFRSVGLHPEQMARYPHEFSGGQRQRLAIARALSLQPQLIVADEPVSALDVSIQASIINLMVDLQEREGLAYLFISHDMAVVEHISHRVAVQYLGKLVEVAGRRDIFTSPQHPYTQALLSAVPVADPRMPRGARILLKGDLPSPSNPPAGCRFHTRCPYVFDRCRIEEPLLRDIRPGHQVACHLR